MGEDPLAKILGEKADVGGAGDRLPHKGGSTSGDGGEDPELLAPDLLSACKENDSKRAQELLDGGVPPGFCDSESGWSCLHWSVYNGNQVLTRALVRAGAARGYKRASATLLQGRATHKHNSRRTPTTPSVPITNTPLHWSSFRGDLGITWILLKEGYSPNDTDQLGNTATHLAAANGHERVLDALIRDGADVRKQNKFKNTPHDVANSAQCKGLLRRAEALPAPSPEEVESMHAKNLQRILEVERVLIEVVGPLDHAQNGRDEQEAGGDDDGGGGGGGGEGEEEKEERGGGGTGRGNGGGGGSSGGGGGGGGIDRQQQQDNNRHSLSSEVKDDGGDGGGDGARTGEGAKGGEEKGGGGGGGNSTPPSSALTAEGKGVEGGGGVEVKGSRPGHTGGESGSEGRADGDGGQGRSLLAEVETIREAVAGAEALCICEDLVAAAGLKIEGLLLQHSIEQQTARVAAAGPILTQEAYTTLVNRLVLLLRRAEDNPRISSVLKKHAKALVDKSHAEYWLQVSAQRLRTVECAEARHVADMDKLDKCIEKASKVGAQHQLVRECRSLLKRLVTEVEISKAIEGFPRVRLPIEVMPKDYWQPEDGGHVEETEGFPLPPVDDEGKPLEYVWVPSDSLTALSTACKRMSEALVGVEGLNPALVERGTKTLQEFNKELKVLQEKDTVDKEKAVGVAVKAAKKLKKKKGGGKKKKKK